MIEQFAFSKLGIPRSPGEYIVPKGKFVGHRIQITAEDVKLLNGTGTKDALVDLRPLGSGRWSVGYVTPFSQKRWIGATFVINTLKCAGVHRWSDKEVYHLQDHHIETLKADKGILGLQMKIDMSVEDGLDHWYVENYSYKKPDEKDFLSY